jgi:hypothetical protein
VPEHPRTNPCGGYSLCWTGYLDFSVDPCEWRHQFL